MSCGCSYRERYSRTESFNRTKWIDNEYLCVNIYEYVYFGNFVISVLARSVSIHKMGRSKKSKLNLQTVNSPVERFNK